MRLHHQDDGHAAYRKEIVQEIVPILAMPVEQDACNGGLCDL